MGTNRRPRVLLAMLLALPFAAGCAAPPFDATAVVREWAAFMDRDYVLKAGDKITVTVYQAEDLTQELVVAPQGTVNLLRVSDPLIASGKSIGTLRREVQAAYAKILQNAEVTVALTEASEKSVYVAGEVKKPGAVAYVSGMTLSQAVSAAGGYDIRAKTSDVRILRYHSKGEARTFRVNLNKVLLDGTSPDFFVLPGDVVWCQTSTIADLNDIVTLYIHRLLPIPVQGFSLTPGG